MTCRSALAAVALAALMLHLAGAPAHGRDGAVEINQDCAVQGGCLPGDAAGFPVTIASHGSYLLTGNLDVADANIDAIEVTSPRGDVSIDLNGFTIGGRVFCTGSGPTLACGGGIGRGIDAEGRPRVRVRNGSILDFAYGVISGDAARIEDVTAVSNGCDGIRVGADSSVAGSIAAVNGGSGIVAGAGSVVYGVSASGNGENGIYAEDDVSVSNSASRGNGVVGISVGAGSVVHSVSARENGAGVTASSASVSNTAASENKAGGIRALESSIAGVSAVGSESIGISCNLADEAGACVIADSLASRNRDGVTALGASVVASAANQNERGFFLTSSLCDGCIAVGNTGAGFSINDHTNVQNCSSLDNGRGGFIWGEGLIGGSLVAGNQSDGLQYTRDGLIQESLVDENLLAGILEDPPGFIGADVFYRDVLVLDSGVANVLVGDGATWNLGDADCATGSSVSNCP